MTIFFFPILTELAKRPPSGAFSSPFGGGRYFKNTSDRCSDTQTDYSGTNKHTGTNKHYSGTNKHDSGTNKHTKKKSRHAKNFFVCALILTLIVLKHFPCHGGSKYVLRFEIESREGGFYSGRTHTQTDGQTDTHTEIGKLV